MLKFMDLSHYDDDRGSIDWNKLNVDGFVIKISEGNTYVDPKAQENFKNAKATGKLVGGYHFYRGDPNEVNNFKSHCPDVDFVAIDCEDAKLTGDLTDNVLKFAESFTIPVLVYGSPSYLKEHFNKAITKLGLWVAHYDVPKPDTVYWSDYAMWQFTSKADEPGKPNNPSDESYVSQAFYDSIKPKPKPIPSTPILTTGDKGPEVKKLQNNLIKVGEHLPRSGADGDFGKETKSAVEAFQARHGLSVDGKAGPHTFSKLKQVLSSLSFHKYYTSKDGDSLSKIAHQEGMSLAEIEKLNPQIKNFNVIWPGEKIRVR